MIGYLLGLVAHYYFQDLHLALTLGLFLALLAAVLAHSNKGVAIQCAGLALALLSATLWAQWQLESRLAQSAQRVDLDLKGRVIGLNTTDQRSYQQFTLEVEETPDLHLRQIRLSVYQSEVKFNEGDRIEARVRLLPPSRYQNSESPDRVLKDLRDSIDARGYLRVLFKHESRPSVRQKLADWILQHFEPQQAATLMALTLGETAPLTRENWRVLKATGTVHLAIISGLHLGVIVFAGFYLGRLLVVSVSRFSPGTVEAWLLWPPVLLAASLATLFLFFGGAGLPLQRAWIMAMVLLGGMLFSRRPSLELRLKIALLLVTLWDPMAVRDLGFWLSFGLVFLLIQMARFRRKQSLIRTAFEVQLKLTLISLPLILYGTSQLNLGSVLTNLWAIPLISLLVASIPLLLPLIELYEPLKVLPSLIIDLFWWGLNFHRALGLNQFWSPPSVLMLLVGSVGAALIFLPVRLRLLGAVLLTLSLFPVRDRVPAGTFRIDILDVGQGQSALIQTSNLTLVYDTGPGFPSGYQVAQLTLVPTLQRRAIRYLNALVLSHSDSDHAGGLSAIEDQFQIETLYSGQPELTGGLSCTELPYWEDLGVEIRLLKLDNRSEQDNDQSCAIWVRDQHCSFLAMGDLSALDEVRLVSEYAISNLTWLQLSHHGSKHSTSTELLKLLDPEQALISRGRFNRFGHPAPSVIDRLKQQGTDILDTAVQGQITLTSNAGNCRAETELERDKRYWESEALNTY